jgi:hypothetical protein
MSTQFLSIITSWEEFASELPRNASDTERLMAAVCYRFEFENVDTTDIGVVANDYFRRARWPRPTNLSATANHCAGRGWLSEAGQAEGHKLWRITRKGHNSIKSRVGQAN